MQAVLRTAEKAAASLIPVLVRGLYRVEGARMAVNYGLNRVRFPAPVRSGDEVRAVAAILAAEETGGAVQLTANQLSGPRFAFQSTGASHVTLDGNVDELLADMTGASELNASALQTKTAEISTTGAADAEIAVAETLKVAITGAGKVSYSGNPTTIEKHITGAGSIRHKD